MKRNRIGWCLLVLLVLVAVTAGDVYAQRAGRGSRRPNAQDMPGYGV